MEKRFDYNGHAISYRVIGKGKPVVLIHGFGEDGNVWSRQIEFLKNKFQLIIPDLPGTGNSEMIDNITIDKMADVVFELIKKENIEQCAMIGHSMGGYITLAFAEKHSDHLTSFGLFHSTSYPDSDEKKAVRKKAIEFIREHGAFEFLRTTSPNLFSPISTEKMKIEIDTFINSLDNLSKETLIAYYEAMMRRPDRVSVLEKARVPVLFIMGQYDNPAPMSDVLKQCHLPERSFIHILTESGHMGMMEETAKSNKALEEFLESV